jgi:ABC-type Fe3+ transport system permease subunit
MRTLFKTDLKKRRIKKFQRRRKTLRQSAARYDEAEEGTKFGIYLICILLTFLAVEPLVMTMEV